MLNTILKYPYVVLLLTAEFSPLAIDPKVPTEPTRLRLRDVLSLPSMTVGYRDRGWYMRELADGEANLVSAMFLAIKGVQQVSEADDRGATFSDLFTNAIFCDIVMLLSATISLCRRVSYPYTWLVSDDGWALVTMVPSFVQYTLLAPSYINILDVSAVSDMFYS